MENENSICFPQFCPLHTILIHTLAKFMLRESLKQKLFGFLIIYRFLKEVPFLYLYVQFLCFASSLGNLAQFFWLYYGYSEHFQCKAAKSNYMYFLNLSIVSVSYINDPIIVQEIMFNR